VVLEMNDTNHESIAAEGEASTEPQRAGWPIGVQLKPRVGAINDVQDLLEQARLVDRLGIGSAWFGQRFDLDSLSVAALVGASVPGLAVGTAIVPINPRHPVVVASQAQTAQAASEGLFTLGLGLGAASLEAAAFGITERRPILRLREYLTVIRALINDGTANFHGDTLVAQPPLSTAVRGGSQVPILVAAMGPQALAVSGELADGTIPFLAGPRTIESHILPAVGQAARRAGRPSPRVVAVVGAVVTDDPDRIRSVAAEQMTFYEAIPSYRKVMDREGIHRAAELTVTGSEEQVTAGLRRYLDAGATEIIVSQTELGGPADQQRTWELVGSLSR